MLLFKEHVVGNSKVGKTLKGIEKLVNIWQPHNG
jgi:hypothetical protein